SHLQMIVTSKNRQSAGVSYRDQLHRALIDLVATMTDSAVSLYEIRDGCVVDVFPEESPPNLEAHCKLIQRFPGGKAACEADRCGRAQAAALSQVESQQVCHAGLFSHAVPIRLRSHVRAVLLFGQNRMED